MTANTNVTCSSRPSHRFVPASERYPAALQQNRKESRLKRQAELLALQERACLSRTEPPQNQEPRLCSSLPQTGTRMVRVNCSCITSNSHFVPAAVVINCTCFRWRKDRASLQPSTLKGESLHCSLITDNSSKDQTCGSGG